jgi:DNA-binding NarL/FixJ family response regulator
MRILVVDDHQLFADGVAWLIRQHYPDGVVLQARDAVETHAVFDRGEEVDLILLDLFLPGVNGLSLLRQLQERGVWAPVLMVSASESCNDARLALDHGALGFLSKSTDGEGLHRAIETVFQGDIYLPEQWASLLSSRAPVAPDNASSTHLTARQHEILHLVSQGLANKLIADRLGLAENTIKGHLREIFRLLRVKNRTSCINEAERLGLMRR